MVTNAESALIANTTDPGQNVVIFLTTFLMNFFKIKIIKQLCNISILK